MWTVENVETKASALAQRAEPLLIIAALAFLGAYAWPIVDPAISDETKSLCASVVWLTWALFVVDYGTRLFIAKDRWAFVRRNALELATVCCRCFGRCVWCAYSSCSSMRSAERRAFVSMTTVGYGDMYPVTTTGRLVAAVLMLAGHRGARQRHRDGRVLGARAGEGHERRSRTRLVTFQTTRCGDWVRID